MQSENLRGIALMLAAMLVLSVMDAAMKELAGVYPALQVAALRGLVSLPILFAWVLWRERSLATLFAVRWNWQIGRGVLGVLMLTSFIYGISHMPLSEAYALFFVAPLVITALSVLLLGEVVGPRRWMAVVVGFGGVMVILRPGIVTPSLATIAVLVSASCYALNAISVRILGRTDSTASMSFWFVGVVALGAGVLAFPNWQPLRVMDMGWLATLAVTGALGQMLITAAFRCAPASVVAPFEYSTLFWGVALDLAIWGELPPPIVFVGAAVIIASGLYLIHRERQSALVVSPSIETLSENERD